jgi:cytidylate kinase
MAGKDKAIQIAIDGPAGAGKSTVARMVAQVLHYKYLDTGAMYRAIAIAMLEAQVLPSNDKAIASILKSCQIEIRNDGQGGNLLYLNGKDVTQQIRQEKISNTVSDFANVQAIRKFLIEKQQAMASSGGVVLDGRDIGTIVLPDAELKIYLTAALALRAKRRHAELNDNNITLAELTELIDRRDEKDANNLYGPMRAAPDAITIGTDHLSISNVVEKIVSLAMEKISTHFSVS